MDECAALNPCKNGGRCQNTRGGYSCSCPQRFAGKICDQSMFRIDCTQPIFVNLCVCVNWYIPFFVPWFYIHHFDIAPAWENSPHLAAPPQVFPWNDIWGTSTEIPCWWRVIKQIWGVLLKGWREFPSQYDLSEVLPKSGRWQVITMEFLRSLLRRNLYRISRINHAIICLYYYPQWFCNFHM